jgi:DNA uptake protein ComE-like DNA-binding protein
MKSIIKHFYFNKRERLALFIFLFLLLLIKWSFHFFKKEAALVQFDYPELQADWLAIDSVKQHTATIHRRDVKTYSKPKITKPLLININQADSFAFRKLPGIGEKYSSRIVRYRNWLGGFHSKEQLLEVYGIDSTLLHTISPFLKLEGDSLKRVNINECSLKDLSSHPYIPYKIAKLIVKYREHHGVYSSLDELKNIPLIDEQLFRKIAVYLELE